jgi:hypothetical protein
MATSSTPTQQSFIYHQPSIILSSASLVIVASTINTSVIIKLAKSSATVQPRDTPLYSAFLKGIERPKRPSSEHPSVSTPSCSIQVCFCVVSHGVQREEAGCPGLLDGQVFEMADVLAMEMEGDERSTQIGVW